MLKFEIEQKTVIFLDHCQLINESFGQHDSNTQSDKYKLKDNLFSFHPKPAKDENTKEEVVKLNENLQALQDLATKVQQYIIDLSIFPKAKCASGTRYWEEKHEFPQFHGANRTDNFQVFRFQAASPASYIIPPHCSFYNHDVLQLTQLLPQLGTYDLIVLDPPWRNKFIRRVKRARIESAYGMLETEQLKQLPLKHLMHASTLVAIWCTNSASLQQALIEELLPAWNLRLLHRLPWCKLNTEGKLIGKIKGETAKQPFEMLFLATCQDNKDFDAQTKQLRNIEMLVGVPSVVHSHKPPLLPWLREYLTESTPQCLEIFARYLQPQFTAIGLEVLKLMDTRLYEKINLADN